MNDRELMQQALDMLEKLNKDGWILADFEDEVYASVEALRARLAEHEPDDGYCQACDGDSCTAKEGCVARDNPPPQREWQGLTDEEIEKLYLGSFDEGQFARAIEAKLKEKNT